MLDRTIENVDKEITVYISVGVSCFCFLNVVIYFLSEKYDRNMYLFQIEMSISDGKTQ